MKRILLCFVASLLIVTYMPIAATSQTSNGKSSFAIRAVLDAQRDAWNKGDIEGFMDGYDRSDNTVFVSGDNVTRGWKTVLERYKKNYDTPEKMGQLTFSDLEVNMLSKDTAVVIGKWHLNAPMTNLTGDSH